jgi:hypothetical protein
MYGKLATEQLKMGSILIKVRSKVSGVYYGDCYTTAGKIYYSWGNSGKSYYIESDNGYPIGVPSNELEFLEEEVNG